MTLASLFHSLAFVMIALTAWTAGRQIKRLERRIDQLEERALEMEEQMGISIDCIGSKEW